VGSPRMNLVAGRPASIAGDVALECLGLQVPLDGVIALVIRNNPSSELVVGLRSEDLRWAQVAPSELQLRLRAEAEIVEPLGSETLVTVAVDGTTLVARFPPRSGVTPGDSVELTFDPGHLHVFDKETGLSLLARD